MTDREEREQVLETLTNMRDWMEAARQIRSTPARINALNYAISSIKTDLKYDLLYEDNQIDDADKMIAEDNSCESNKSENPTSSTTKKDLVVDCISRKAALDITWHDPSYSDPLNVLTEVRDKIRELPSVTPIRPKGHWIGHREHCEMNNLRPSGLGSYFWCSECDCGIDSKNFSRVNYNYCPNCGAKMVESEEE